MNKDGSGLRSLHTFTALSGTANTNLDGANPVCRLAVSGNTLYGTTKHGGKWGKGTVFKVGLDASWFTVLHHFTGGKSEGAYPQGGLVISGDTLYGTTFSGGNYSGGTVYALNFDGTGFTNLYHFAGMSAFGGDPRGGTNPTGSLLLFENSLYGTTTYGGVDADGNLTGNGTVFGLIDRISFTVLHTFTVTSGAPYYTNSDGVNPNGGLVASGDTLYGTTFQGGTGNSGTVFAMGAGGAGFKTLHNFSPPVNGTNSDGARPLAGLIVSGNTLYGTTCFAGTIGDFGTVFCMNSDGSDFQTLHSFAGLPTDAQLPFAGVVLSGNALYGTTYTGGTFGAGTIYRIIFQPQLTSSIAGGNIVLTWPTAVAGLDYSGFTMQSTADFASRLWTTNFPPAAPIDGRYTLRVPITGDQQFFRLSQ